MTPWAPRALEELQLSLTPKDIVLIWLYDVREYPSFHDYVEHLSELPWVDWPEAHMIDWVMLSAFHRSNRLSAAERVEAAKAAVRDYRFLFQLIELMNRVVYRELTQLRGECREAIRTFQLLLVSFNQAHGGIRKGKLLGQQSRPVDQLVPKVMQDLEHLSATALALQGASQQIGETYFGGRQILFRDNEQLLQQTTECIGSARVEFESFVQASAAPGGAAAERSAPGASGDLPEKSPGDGSGKIVQRILEAARFEAVSLTDSFEKAMEAVRPKMKMDRVARFRAALQESLALKA